MQVIRNIEGSFKTRSELHVEVVNVFQAESHVQVTFAGSAGHIPALLVRGARHYTATAACLRAPSWHAGWLARPVGRHDTPCVWPHLVMFS